jgi:DNA-binding MltR family transcriptional regulator
MANRLKRLAPPTASELADDAGRILNALEQPSHRAVAVIGAAFLDDALRAALRASFIAASGSAERIFEGLAPLNSMAARAMLAYCLGLFGKETYRDLESIKDIRNLFAHEHREIGFDSQEIANACRKLEIVRTVFDADEVRDCSPRWLFMFAVALLSSHLILVGARQKHPDRGPDFGETAKRMRDYVLGRLRQEVQPAP